MTEYEFQATTWDGKSPLALASPAGSGWAVYSIVPMTSYVRDAVGTSNAAAVVWVRVAPGSGIGMVGAIS